MENKIEELILKGIPAAPGITMGKAYPLSDEEVVVPRRKINEKLVGSEITRFKNALAKTRSEILVIHKKIAMEMALLLKENKILLIKRPPKGLLANMWALPATEVKRGNPGGYSIRNDLEKFYQIKILQKPVLIGTVNHAFTHRVWLMKLYHFSSFSDGNFGSLKEKWVTLSQLNDYAIPTAFKKLFNLLSSSQKETTLSHRRKGSLDNPKRIE